MTSPKFIFWFRQDLRLEDNPGLHYALSQGPVIPIFILDNKIPQGAASKVWLHHALKSLNQSLEGKLHYYEGDSLTIIMDLVQQHQVKGVYWNRRYNPKEIQIDQSIKSWLLSHTIDCQSFKSSLLFEPWDYQRTTPYQVFTPFYKASLALGTPRKPFKAPPSLKNLIKVKTSDLNFLPAPSWHKSVISFWKVGEQNAQQKLQDFCTHLLKGYAINRDQAALYHTSRLSPHLHFGEISPYQIWHTLDQESLEVRTDIEAFKRELIWREFCYYTLFYHPTLQTENFNLKFNQFKWQNNPILLKAWQQGKTGIPIVDAGMRELWKTGTLHNRVRMIVASFLVKNCLIHWIYGEQWFFDCLFDADIASNAFNWQWVSGTGFDAAPYFRIFNPVLQSQKFDANGAYIQYFVPELSQLPPPHLFAPWLAPKEILDKAKIILGQTYPFPIVDLSTSRKTALSSYKKIKNTSQ